MFSGLISRQTMLFWWRQESPRKISMIQNREMSQVSLRYRLMRPKSSPPGQYSTINTRNFSVSNANFICMRKGWAVSFMILRSFIMMFFFLFFTITYLSITFIAQNCPSFLSRHRKTLEKPPEPIILMTSKLSKERDSLSSKLVYLAAGLRYRDWPFRNCPAMLGCVSRQSRVTWTGTERQQQVLGCSFLRAERTSPILTTSMKCSTSSLPSMTITLQFLPYSCLFKSSFSFCWRCWWLESRVEIMVDFSPCRSILDEEEQSLFLANLEWRPEWASLGRSFWFLRSEKGSFVCERWGCLSSCRWKSLRFLEEEWYCLSSSMERAPPLLLSGNSCRQIFLVVSAASLERELLESSALQGDLGLERLPGIMLDISKIGNIIENRFKRPIKSRRRGMAQRRKGE